MSRPQISVLTPAYNASAFIAETIRSVQQQSLDDWEHVVVDDGSTDDTAAVVRAAGDGRLVLIRQENAGQSAAQNVALARARGRLVVMLDADDMLLPDAFARLSSALDARPDAVLAYGKAWLVDPAGAPIDARQVFADRPSDVALENLLERNLIVTGGATMIRADAMRAVGGFDPDIRMADGAVIEGDGWAIRAVHTPGHTANHAAFGLEETGILFSADHVMAWATTIVAPPDGAMADFMASLEALMQRDDRLYLPGHGGPVTRPAQFLRGLRTHRRMRERAILERLRAGDRTIAGMVAKIYRDTDPRLHGAAGLSVLAHLEDLVARGAVQTDGPPAIDGVFIPA